MLCPYISERQAYGRIFVSPLCCWHTNPIYQIVKVRRSNQDWDLIT